MDAELPGTSQLIIDVMDKDTIGYDDLIGSTVIDLEDRWFSKEWQDLGKENMITPDANPLNARWNTKPVESRILKIPTSSQIRGTLQCWVDIMKPQVAISFPPDDVSLPPTQVYFNPRKSYYFF